jgi:hypothetical protein
VANVEEVSSMLHSVQHPLYKNHTWSNHWRTFSARSSGELMWP